MTDIGPQAAGRSGELFPPNFSELIRAAREHAVAVPGTSQFLHDTSLVTDAETRSDYASSEETGAITQAFDRAFTDAQERLAGVDPAFQGLRFEATDLSLGRCGLTVEVPDGKVVFFNPFTHVLAETWRALKNNEQPNRRAAAEDMAETVRHELTRAVNMDQDHRTPAFRSAKRQVDAQLESMREQLTNTFLEVLNHGDYFDELRGKALDLNHARANPEDRTGPSGPGDPAGGSGAIGGFAERPAGQAPEEERQLSARAPLADKLAVLGLPS